MHKTNKMWNMASVSEDEGEIVLYGDIESQQPTDWWTGEPVPGLFITPEGFMEDLETVKGKSKITVKLNSCGGDLYTGIAIHNAIKALSADVTVVVEGIAASAASIIMCAGSKVQVYPGSIVMIHEPACTVVDYCNKDDLKQIIKMLDAGIDAAAAVYNDKTGLEVDALKTMMHKETWMTGREAIDKGFADELISGDVDTTFLEANGKKVLMVAGIKHDAKGFHIPESLMVNRISAADESDAEINKPGDITGALEEGGTTEMFNSVEELKAAMPELVSQIEASAAEAAVKAAVEEAVSAERARQKSIDEISASIADAELVNDAKYEHPCSAEELAFTALKKQAQLGATMLTKMSSDNRESGAQDITAVAVPTEQPKQLTKEERMALGRADAKAVKNNKEE